MERRKLLFMAAASMAAMLTGAFAQPRHDRDRDRHGRGRGRGRHDDWGDRDPWHWRDDRGRWHGDHDRYWRREYGRRRYIGHDYVYRTLRHRRYRRWEGDPYWFQGRYIIRAYDRRGRLVFVEINPYTGAFIGEIRF